jgi:hypothetical protein
MDTKDAVIGCDAIDASNQWLRLRTTSGIVRTIPWSAIKFAGWGDNFAGSLTIGKVTDKVMPLYATHDSLWIAYGKAGFAQAMMEKATAEKPNRRREEILGIFAQQLDTRWRADRMTVTEISTEFMREGAADMASGMKKSLLIFAAVLIVVIAVLVYSAYK